MYNWVFSDKNIWVKLWLINSNFYFQLNFLLSIVRDKKFLEREK